MIQTILILIAIILVELAIIILLIWLLKRKRVQVINTYNDKIIDYEKYKQVVIKKKEVYSDKIKKAKNYIDLLNITHDVLRDNADQNKKL